MEHKLDLFVHPPLKRVVGQQRSRHPVLLLNSFTFPTVSALNSGLSVPITETSPDSCYSSCSEIESHPSLSRESSDSTSLSNAFSTQCSVSSSVNDHIEFATKLGYSMEQIETVLQSLESIANVGQDQVLSELIKLGKTPSASKKLTPALVQNISDGGGVLSTTNGMDPQPRLRPIIIDGSNLAIHHGRKEYFSCLGIRKCVNFFVERGHQEIYVFVPQYRGETPKADWPVHDQHILFELEKEQRLIWTPSRRINGRRVVCHDRYVLKTALEKSAIIVSNDVYRDLVREHPEYKQLVAQRLLMYSFVDGKFVPPEDPLGRRGPKLDRFLQTDPPFTMQLCPYRKKCTYGNKCKYYHPERVNGIHMTITERLFNKNDVKKQGLSARPSLAYELDPFVSGNREEDNLHDKIVRARSLNLPLNPVDGPTNVDSQSSRVFNSPEQILFDSPSQLFDSISQRYNSPDQGFNSPPPGQNTHQHRLLNRHISAPNQLQIPGFPSTNQMLGNRDVLSSTSSLNQQHSYNERTFQMFTPNNVHSHTFTPPKSIWNSELFSLSPLITNAEEQMLSGSPAEPLFETRQRIQYNLSQIFPETSVIAVLNAHPTETNAQRLCQKLLAFQSGFNS